MPQYDFFCKCGHHVEVICSIEDRNSPVCCPKCQERMSRAISLTAPVQWSGPLNVSNITGNPKSVVYSAKEAEAVAKKHGQQIVTNYEAKTTPFRKKPSDDKANKRRDLEKILKQKS